MDPTVGTHSSPADPFQSLASIFSCLGLSLFFPTPVFGCTCIIHLGDWCFTLRSSSLDINACNWELNVCLSVCLTGAASAKGATCMSPSVSVYHCLMLSSTTTQTSLTELWMSCCQSSMTSAMDYWMEVVRRCHSVSSQSPLCLPPLCLMCANRCQLLPGSQGPLGVFGYLNFSVFMAVESRWFIIDH